MIDTPFFSIVVPVYNTSQYLRGTLDCIKNQTFSSFEVLLVDDGSSDGSGEMCDEYAIKDNRFRVFHQSNAGVSAARNRALDNANGQYIGFVDSDDTLLPDMLSHFYSIIQKNGADIVQSEGPVYKSRVPNRIDSLITLERGSAMDEFFKIGKVRPSLWLGVYKATLFHNIRFPEKIYQWEDYAIIAVLVSRCKLVSITSKRFYNYEYHVGSATKRPMTEKHLSCLLIDDYLISNNVYRYKQDHFDVVGFFIRCCCFNFLNEPPIDRNKYREEIRKLIVSNKQIVKRSRAVHRKERIVIMSFLWSEVIARSILVLERELISALSKTRAFLKECVQ